MTWGDLERMPFPTFLALRLRQVRGAQRHDDPGEGDLARAVAYMEGRDG